MTAPTDSRPAGAWARALCLLLLSFAPVAYWVVFGVEVRQRLDPGALTHDDGFNFVADLPPAPYAPILSWGADTPTGPQQSPTRLLENDRDLGPAHERHAVIRQLGEGAFSHWGQGLYLSSSDGSDPRTNGREYAVLLRARLPFGAAVAWAVWLLVSLWRAPAGEGPVGSSRRQLAGVTAVVAGAVPGMAMARGTSVPGWLLAGSTVVCLWGVLDVASRAARLMAAAELPPPFSTAVASVAGVAAATRRLGSRIESAASGADRTGRALHWGLATLPLLAFGLVLALPVSPQLLEDVSTRLALVLAVALPCLWIGYGGGRLGAVAAATVTLALFALPLDALWQDTIPHAGGSVVGGLLPYSDAAGYYYDARRLHEGVLLGWSARRPLFVALLAPLLAVTGGHLQIVLAMLAVLNGVATVTVAHEVRRWQGAFAAALVTVLCFAFYRLEGGVGTTLTENLGFAMGALGTAMLLKSVQEAQLKGAMAAMACLTFALMARAGAFFVLPALIVAVAWSLREKTPTWRGFVGLSAATAGAAGAVLVFGAAMRDPASSQTAFSNFSYTLYGLVVGGKGWVQVLRDHPTAQEGAEIYALAWEAFKARPMGLVEGAAKAWLAYFSPSESYNAYGFLKDGPRSFGLQTLALAVSGLGMLAGVVRRDRIGMVVAAGVIGHLASIPFVPSTDAGLRVYASTMPLVFLILIPGVEVLRQGAGALVGIGTPSPVVHGWAVPDSALPQWLAAGVALTVFVGAPLVYLTSARPVARAVTCAPGELPFQVRMAPGAFLRIRDDREGPVAGLPATAVLQSRLAASVAAFELGQDAAAFTAGRTFLITHDALAGQQLWLLAPTGQLVAPGRYDVCASSGRGIYVASRATRIGSE